MKPDFSLPPELAALEQRLQSVVHDAPSAALRARCWQAYQVEKQGREASTRWRFLVALAAMILLWLNVSWFSGIRTNLRYPTTVSHASWHNDPQLLQDLVPELDPAEARRQLVLLNSSSGLMSCPALTPTWFQPQPSPPQQSNFSIGESLWDTF